MNWAWLQEEDAWVGGTDPADVAVLTVNGVKEAIGVKDGIGVDEDVGANVNDGIWVKVKAVDGWKDSGVEVSDCSISWGAIVEVADPAESVWKACQVIAAFVSTMPGIDVAGAMMAVGISQESIATMSVRVTLARGFLIFFMLPQQFFWKPMTIVSLIRN